jgi:sugar phosphate isomerase/epimerase
VTPLTYCSNIHPGESWADVMRNLESHVAFVKRAVSPRQAFPLGLRLSNRAVTEADADRIGRFRDWCRRNGCFVLTANGFPYTDFHDRVVKQSVYDPDWRSRERVRYTKRLADVLAEMIKDTDVPQVSISTVPIAYKPSFHEEDWKIVRAHLIEVLQHLDRIRERTGTEIRLAIEPEPMCVLEQTTEAIRFFQRMRICEPLGELIGLCFDCCHQAVEFEQPADCLRLLAEAGIRIVKVQVSSALRAVGDEVANLLSFAEPTYLHQVVARIPGQSLERFPDLPDFARFLEHHPDIEECRVHFHVPIFLDHLGTCGTTRFFIEDLLPRLDPAIPLEVETYSFNALPERLRQDSVGASIARELAWVQQILQEKSPAPDGEKSEISNVETDTP